MSVIKANITAMSAYAPPLEGRNPNAYTLLDFNERTIPVSEPIKQALVDYINQDRLQMYPSYSDIVDRLAFYTGVSSDQLMITNGSDQGIDLVFRAVSAPGGEAIIPAPSFAMYTQCAGVEDLTIISAQYTREGGYPIEEVLSAINPKTVLIVVSNPNNPCGTLTAKADIVRLAQAAPHAAILVDECYFEYCQKTVVDCVGELENVFVTRTFSKTWGLPSLRFGYLVSSQANIRALCNIRGPYDINQLAVVAVNAALDHPEYTQRYVNEVMQHAKPMLERWLDQHSMHYWASAANYIWVFPEQPEQLDRYLSQEGVLVRAKALGDSLGLRITVGTVEQVKQLINVWERWLDM